MNDAAHKVDCLKCVHFAVTWEPKRPKSCTLFGFKSAALPSVVVYRSTGSPCMGFQPKKTEPKPPK